MDDDDDEEVYVVCRIRLPNSGTNLLSRNYEIKIF